MEKKQENLRAFILKNRATFLEQQVMPQHEIEIQNLMGNLDQVVIKYEAKWGIDRLQYLVDPETREKWFHQFDKLCAAIEENNIMLLRDLVPGTIRAYAVMEAKAMEMGATPNKPEVWDIALPNSDRILRVCKCIADAPQVAQEGHDVWSLEEIANFISINGRLCNRIKEVFPGATVERPAFDFEKGDEIPEF